MFSILDLDDNGKISCEEFIKSFMQIEEEVKAHLNAINAKYTKEKENNSRLFKLIIENKGEKLSEGMSSNGK